jgi:hypothetical protein
MEAESGSNIPGSNVTVRAFRKRNRFLATSTTTTTTEAPPPTTVRETLQFDAELFANEFGWNGSSESFGRGKHDAGSPSGPLKQLFIDLPDYTVTNEPGAVDMSKAVFVDLIPEDYVDGEWIGQILYGEKPLGSIRLKISQNVGNIKGSNFPMATKLVDFTWRSKNGTLWLCMWMGKKREGKRALCLGFLYPHCRALSIEQEGTLPF